MSAITDRKEMLYQLLCALPTLMAERRIGIMDVIVNGEPALAVVSIDPDESSGEVVVAPLLITTVHGLDIRDSEGTQAEVIRGTIQ